MVRNKSSINIKKKIFFLIWLIQIVTACESCYLTKDQSQAPEMGVQVLVTEHQPKSYLLAIFIIFETFRENMWCLNRQNSLGNELKLLFIYVGYKEVLFKIFSSFYFLV